MSAAARRVLEDVFRAALEAVDPHAAVAGAVERRGETVHLAGRPLAPGARLVALAVGKAAAPMAAAAEARLGDALGPALAVTRPDHGLPLGRFVVREAGHPVPDARGEAAAREALALVRRAPPLDALLVLLSGGASALWTCPLPGLTLADVAATTRALLGAGAPIDELNAVRKHLCELAGGRLARAAADAGAARVCVLALSDVAGDRLDVIGSGPCAPDPTRYADACGVLERRLAGAALPEAVRAHLAAGARGERPESPKPGDPCFAGVDHHVLASNATALAAAARAASAAGLTPRVVTRELAGEAREAGRRLAALARSLRAAGRPACLLAGGETTVTVRGPGRGGRSQELALAAALELAGTDGVTLLAAGTDGSDGPTDAAGAFADGGTRARGRAAGRDAAADLARNDSHAFFRAEGGLLRTGPTRTNVRDLVLVAVGGP